MSLFRHVLDEVRSEEFITSLGAAALPEKTLLAVIPEGSSLPVAPAASPELVSVGQLHASDDMLHQLTVGQVPLASVLLKPEDLELSMSDPLDRTLSQPPSVFGGSDSKSSRPLSMDEHSGKAFVPPSDSLTIQLLRDVLRLGEEHKQ
uniref:Uncharacterized protein n=1 Tax=Pyrodinium bahamense TaxID=73915 RepID=A0A7S0FXC1_9DINO